MNIYIYTSVFIQIHTYIHKYIDIYISVCICTSLFTYIHIYTHKYIYTHKMSVWNTNNGIAASALHASLMHIYLNIHTGGKKSTSTGSYIYTYLHICTYMHYSIYIYIYMYIYIYICTHMKNLHEMPTAALQRAPYTPLWCIYIYI